MDINALAFEFDHKEGRALVTVSININMAIFYFIEFIQNISVTLV